MNPVRKNVVTLLAGMVFAIGLGLSGMTQPAKVIGFLDPLGAWDPTLLFVMMGAIAVHLPVSLWVKRKGMLLPDIPCAGDAPEVKPRTDLMTAAGALPVLEQRPWRPLLAGSVIFGIGWGLSGYCPGPAVVSLASGAMGPLVFVPAMLIGMFVYRGINQRRPAAPTVASSGRGEATAT